MFAAVALIHGGFSRFNRTTSSPRRPHIDRPTTKRALKFAFTTLSRVQFAGTQATISTLSFVQYYLQLTVAVRAVHASPIYLLLMMTSKLLDDIYLC